MDIGKTLTISVVFIYVQFLNISFLIKLNRNLQYCNFLLVSPLFPKNCCYLVAQLCLTLHDPMEFSIPGLLVLYYVPVCSNSYPLSPWCHPTISSSVIHFSSCLFQWFSSSHQVAKTLELELQLQHQSFQWIFRVISFRTDWFDILSVQGTLKSLLQHYSLKATILWCSAFFMV